MEITQTDILYFLVLAASIHLTWGLAKRQGIADTLDYLRDKGEIDFDD